MRHKKQTKTKNLIKMFCIIINMNTYIFLVKHMKTHGIKYKIR